MTLSTENKRGSDCTGSDGEANRVLTLANTQLTQSGGFNVFVNGLNLVPTTEYSVTHADSASTITFLNVVWDTDYIVVVYIEQGSTLTGNYCSANDVYNRSGLSATEIASATVEIMISDAEAELEAITGRKFTDSNQLTEFLSIKDKDLVGNYQSSFIVSHYPIQSITECKILDADGNATTTFDTLSSAEILVGTYESDDYWLEVANDTITNTMKPTGRVILKTQTLPEGTNNLKVGYTYGYASVPTIITDLASCMAGLRAWVYVLGGNYDGANNYSLSEFSVNIGDLFIRGKQNMEFLKTRIDSLLDRVGIKQRTLFFATGSDR